MKQPIYLDYNATTPIDRRVLDEMLPVLTDHYGNPASSTHPFGWYAEELVQVARERVAALIDAEPSEIVFTSGATEACNLAVNGILAGAGGQAPAAVTAATEHKAVLDPLAFAAKRGCAVDVLPVARDGSIDTERFAAAIRPQTALAAIMLANNEIGTLHGVRRLAQIAGERGVSLFCDATQAVGKIPVSVKALGVDMLALSAHKLYGPKGVGALYISKSARRVPVAQIHGGGHEGGYRSGTLNVPGIVGLGAAARIAAAEMGRDSQHAVGLCARLLELLREAVPDAALNGSVDDRLPGNLNVLLPGIDNVRLLGMVSTKVAFSLSSACQSQSKHPSYVLQALGLSADEQRQSIRLSVGRFSTAEEIEEAGAVLAAAARKIRR